jgi:hypothetical protein
VIEVARVHAAHGQSVLAQGSLHLRCHAPRAATTGGGVHD